jgi:hypothetical protein
MTAHIFRIRVYALHTTGMDMPPGCFSDIDKIQDFIIQSANVRMEYPGLCAFEFDNIMQITIEHLLGWDQSKKENKPNHGIFGNLNGYRYAVEEQGRKMLHAHMLLWIQEWNDLYKRISSDEFCNQAKEELKQYANKVMSSTIIGNKNRVKDLCVNSDCRRDQASNVEKASLQDVRCLRFKKGESSFGGKSIVKCPNCDNTYSPEEIIINTLKKVIPQITRTGAEIEAGELFLRPAATSKARMIIEMQFMQDFIPSWQYVRKQTTEFCTGKDPQLLIAVLRNHHLSCHCKTCFKKDIECWMKIPKPECLSPDIMYTDNATNWYNWTGNNNPRRLFYLSSQRLHCDCFSNTYNEVASNLFGCNTNVVASMDGGSAMYCTCYTVKSTKQEDDEHFD